MGGGSAVDGSLDDGVLVTKSVHEGGVRVRFALDDPETGMREEGGGKYRGIPEEGGDGMLFVEAGCESSRTDAAWDIFV